MRSAMKKIVLIGASGFIGSVILKEAIDRGHHVTGIVRHPEKITLIHKNLHVEKADIFFTEKITGIFEGADAVISSYNPGWTNPKIAEDTTTGYKSIIEAVRQSGVKRLMIVGGAGSLFVSPGKRLMDTGAIPESYMPAIRALANVFLIDLANEKDIDWVFFSPAINIHPGTRTGKFRLGKDDVILNQAGEGDISVQDYAVAMIDELEKPVHHHERFTIGY
jgi:uncharacterized protein